jgi:hypothetical protein
VVTTRTKQEQQLRPLVFRVLWACRHTTQGTQFARRVTREITQTTLDLLFALVVKREDMRIFHMRHSVWIVIWERMRVEFNDQFAHNVILVIMQTTQRLLTVLHVRVGTTQTQQEQQLHLRVFHVLWARRHTIQEIQFARRVLREIMQTPLDLLFALVVKQEDMLTFHTRHSVWIVIWEHMQVEFNDQFARVVLLGILQIPQKLLTALHVLAVHTPI